MKIHAKTALFNDLKNIEILHGEDGKPEFSGYALSISHSNGYAIAVAQKNEIVPSTNKLESRKVSDTDFVSDDTFKQSTNIAAQGFSKTTTLALIVILSLIISNASDLIFWVNSSIF